MIKIFTTAHLPQPLVNAWLQHLRDFDTAHPECHFEVAVDTPDLPLSDVIAQLRIDPSLNFTQIYERKKP